MKEKKLVYTIQDLCRVCYTCVRECPVKAIKIINGQAQVIPERCIACGNCTKVCSQGAKAIYDSTSHVTDLLKNSSQKVAAIIAPSFPAEFREIKDYGIFLSMVRKLGFDYVNEVSFGADMVATQYKKLLSENSTQHYISSDCPAIVSFIERYHPGLIENMAPIVSPMVATARILKKIHGNNVKIVFIGPCIAKKDESEEIDEALTFMELRRLFLSEDIFPEDVEPSEFDEPLGGRGSIFPVSRGLMQTVDIHDDIIEGKVLVASGRINFPEVIKEFEKGQIEAQHLELLCCEGCIMGPGMSANGKLYARKNLISNYVREKRKNMDSDIWEKQIKQCSNLDFTRKFNHKEQPSPVPTEMEIAKVLKRMGKVQPQDHLDCGACGYETCRNHAMAVINGLAEIEMCLPYTIDTLHNSVNELAISNEKLISMRQTLKQAEKLAHMGQLSAGIAHELNNPLGVIIMYSNILLEECQQNSELHNDLNLIVEQSERCKKIVGGLLNFARKNQVNYSSTDVNVLMKRSISSIIIPDNIALKINSNLSNPVAELDQEQMIQVISNLVKNATEAVHDGGIVRISMEDNDKEITLKISDNGTGIKKEDLEKVFEPFFTTKGIGKGTGLGLATAYGVVKMHKGQINVTSNTDKLKGDTGTTFTITLPRQKVTA